MDNITMTENLQIELEGLKNQVDRLWGSESPSMEKVILRAKAMLENSYWTREAEKREKRDEERKKAP